MITYIRTNSDNKDFQKLVAVLDEYLRILDGEEHLFYSQLNKTDKIKCAIVAYENETPVGCGAIREHDEKSMEVKRMYVQIDKRGKGIATGILGELEKWAMELNYDSCVLETGKRQPEAIALYKKTNYKIIPSFGKYKNVENSVCFEKKLKV